MFENGYSDGQKEGNPESWCKHITGLSQHLLEIFNLHFRNCKKSRQYKGHLYDDKYLWIFFKYFCKFLQFIQGNVMFNIYDLIHFHLQAIILIRNTDSLSTMELLERPEERLPSVRWETYAGLVNWFSNVIFMQIRHGCSWLNHDYTKSRFLGHRLLIIFTHQAFDYE